MPTIKELELRKRQIQSDISKENQRHEDAINALKWEECDAQTQINMICNGLDSEKILHAEHVLRVSGEFEGAGGDRDKVIKKVTDQIIEGGGILFTEYIGTKNYDRFRGQFISCTYGCAPSHGSVVFSIGLQPAIRNKRTPLSDEQIEDCLYYLNNLKSIQKSKVAHRTATS